MNIKIQRSPSPPILTYRELKPGDIFKWIHVGDTTAICFKCMGGFIYLNYTCPYFIPEKVYGKDHICYKLSHELVIKES